MPCRQGLGVLEGRCCRVDQFVGECQSFEPSKSSHLEPVVHTWTLFKIAQGGVDILILVSCGPHAKMSSGNTLRPNLLLVSVCSVSTCSLFRIKTDCVFLPACALSINAVFSTKHFSSNRKQTKTVGELSKMTAVGL